MTWWPRLPGLMLAGGLLLQASAVAGADASLGARVHVINTRMPLAEIQRLVDGVAARQLESEFGPDREALLFEPGNYGTAEQPLTIPVGYYTSVAGLGADPRQVVIHGRIQVRNRCFNRECVALDNFWRSLSNLTLQVVRAGSGCEAEEIWAVSQAAPVRRLNVAGEVRLSDFCTQPSYASGGYIADSVFDGLLENGGQQQFFVRNSRLQHWSGGVWNQVFSGVEGALPDCVQAGACPYTALDKTPVIREAPYLFVDEHGQWRVFRPALRIEARGTSWSSGQEAGASRPLSGFFIASPQSGLAAMNAALRQGQDLLLTPGIYRLEAPLEVTHDGAVVLGLGFATLIPERGTAALLVHAAKGVSVAGVVIEAGATRSPVLLQVGDDRSGDAADPTSLHDVFFRIGGTAAGRAAVSLKVNSSRVILDHIWAWRADHGEGVGWTNNEADTGLVVDGADVSAYGLFVEHYQKHEVIWNGDGGRVIFFQNEMPYDPPAQSAWRARAGEDGYAALLVTGSVKRFSGLGWGSYSFFNQCQANPGGVFAERAFEVPAGLPAGSIRGAFTIFLDAKHGCGGIRHVINGAGLGSTRDNPDLAVRVPAYP